MAGLFFTFMISTALYALASGYLSALDEGEETQECITNYIE